MNRRVLKAAAILVLAAILAGLGWLLLRSPDAPEEDIRKPEATEPEESQWGRTVIRDGHTWRYNSRLRTVLFMGIDVDSDVEIEGFVGNAGRADALALLVVDPDANTLRVISMSRDTITKVDVYDRDRTKLYSGNMQINMQYSFGDSPERSCMLMKRKVSSVLYDLPIDYYCSMTMDGIAAAADWMGGISLTLADDWTDVDPAYTKGKTVVLDSSNLEHFLRYRDLHEVESNEKRIDRHTWFVQELFKQMDLHSRNLSSLLDAMAPYLEANLDTDLLDRLSGCSLLEETLTVPGTSVAGRRHVEFYIDEEALQQMLLDVFYEQVD